MPALGAPACYRRIACGTEKWSPSNGAIDNIKAARVAEIIGEEPAATMAIMGMSPGALELLPNHLYPKPWLYVHVVSRVNHKDVSREIARFPAGNPYDLYRDLRSWYRVIDPALVDPAKKYRGDQAIVERIVKDAVGIAEKFHRQELDTYYHPNTYVFYGADPDQKSFGTVHWVARDPGDATVFTEANMCNASMSGYDHGGRRRVRIEGRAELTFTPARQDVAGDSTVPFKSGAAPREKVMQAFEMRGFDHQGAFNHEPTQLLVQHLIAKVVQKMP
jgi:hypothetical protein